MTYLFDTNHAIAHLNGDLRLVPHLTAAQTAGDTFAIPTTAFGELYHGAHTSQRVSDNLTKLTAFVAQLIVFDFDTAAREFGKIKAEQHAKGKPVPTADARLKISSHEQGLTAGEHEASRSRPPRSP